MTTVAKERRLEPALIKAQVEPALHRQVKSHAAAQGMTIREYILQLVRRDLRERESKKEQ
ncbi:MAG: hypothetical protein M3P49_17810 [Actinomycetota bacterium]|nr:hypothetical protein [Actinomycetota bacterium]